MNSVRNVLQKSNETAKPALEQALPTKQPQS
jgi:hypothetical protein